MMSTAATSTRLISSLTVGGWFVVGVALASAVYFVRALVQMDGTAKREARAVGWAIVLMLTVSWLMNIYG